jgi:hypothetical protein
MNVRPEFTLVGENKIIGSNPTDACRRTRRERYQVLTLRDDTIIDMQGCASRREAERFARRH